MKKQQRVDPELAWVVRWRETGEEPTEGEILLDKQGCFYPGKRGLVEGRG
jgi:hypothetical protein